MKTLRGTFTAIVTPFTNNGAVDFEKLKELVEDQIEKGITGLVPCGTTGESPTLSHREHAEVVECVIKKANNRVPIIAGAGSNCTREAIERTLHAKNAGADAVLIVNPYYNKPTQEGLFLHFTTIADSVDIPIVLYNIMGRTGVNVETDTLLRIIEKAPNVVAVKEASGDMEQMKDVINRTPDDFIVLSGDDGLALELIKNGGDGLVSVASNLFPKKVSQLIDNALNKNFEEADKLQFELADFFAVEFIETNPIPIKAAMAMKGLIEETYRLPMCNITNGARAKLKSVLENMNVL